MLSEEKKNEYLELLNGQIGFCITHNVICDTPELMYEHKTSEHEKVWITNPCDENCSCQNYGKMQYS